MKREIKYRCWDKITKQFVPLWTIHWKAWDSFNVFTINYVTIEIDGTLDRMDHEVHLQQSTGLKDKNGREIYEGDICKTIPYEKEMSEIFVTKWGILQNCGDCFNDSGIGFNFYMNELDHLEVVGNIYEHKLEDFK